MPQKLQLETKKQMLLSTNKVNNLSSVNHHEEVLKNYRVTRVLVKRKTQIL